MRTSQPFCNNFSLVTKKEIFLGYTDGILLIFSIIPFLLLIPIAFCSLQSLIGLIVWINCFIIILSYTLHHILWIKILYDWYKSDSSLPHKLLLFACSQFVIKLVKNVFFFFFSEELHMIKLKINWRKGRKWLQPWSRKVYWLC